MNVYAIATDLPRVWLLLQPMNKSLFQVFSGKTSELHTGPASPRDRRTGPSFLVPARRCPQALTQIKPLFVSQRITLELLGAVKIIPSFLPELPLQTGGRFESSPRSLNGALRVCTLSSTPRLITQSMSVPTRGARDTTDCTKTFFHRRENVHPHMRLIGKVTI